MTDWDSLLRCTEVSTCTFERTLMDMGRYGSDFLGGFVPSVTEQLLGAVPSPHQVFGPLATFQMADGDGRQNTRFTRELCLTPRIERLWAACLLQEHVRAPEVQREPHAGELQRHAGGRMVRWDDAGDEVGR